MIEFNELRVTDDSQYLIIDVQVNPDTYYSDVYIDSIYIDDLDTFVSKDSPVGGVFTYTTPEPTKHLRFKLSKDELGVSIGGTLFFVYVTTYGEPDEDAPCSDSGEIVMLTVIDLQPIYRTLMKYIREVENSCEMPTNFIDQFLRLKALQLALTAGNYTLAILYWKKFFSNLTPKPTVCGCYGRVKYTKQ